MRQPPSSFGSFFGFPKKPVNDLLEHVLLLPGKPFKLAKECPVAVADVLRAEDGTPFFDHI